MGRRCPALLPALLPAAVLIAIGAPVPARGACGDGGVAWVRGLASPKGVSLRAIAATADGGVVAAGHFHDALEVTGTGAKAPGLRAEKEPAVFVLKLSAKGEVAWMRRMVGIDLIQGVNAIAVAHDGTIVVGGSYKRPATLEGAPGARPIAFPGDGARERVFVASYGPDGTPRAVRVLAENTASGALWMGGLALSGDTIAISGTFGQEIWIGTGAARRKLTTAQPNRGGAFVAVVGPDGAPIWAQQITADNQASPGRIAFANDGSLLVTGRFAEDRRKDAPPGPRGARFSEAPAIVLRAVGDSDAFAARVGRSGKIDWALSIGGDERNRSTPTPGAIMMPASEEIARVLPGADGDALLVGVSPLPVRFGGGGPPLRAAGYSGSYVARVSRAGKLRAAVALGPFQTRAAASLPGGDLLVAGSLDGNITLPDRGSKPVSLTSAGQSDSVLARHGPDGTLRWASRLGGTGNDFAIDVAADAAGAVTIAARFERDFAIGQDGCRTVRAGPEGARDTFLVRLAPGAALSDETRERRLAAIRTEVAALGKTAAREFKARRYAAACDAYRQITVATPDAAAAMADLALCLQRLGKKVEAIAANRRALALGASTELESFGDEATRRHAYYNLGKLGVTVKLPDDGCGPLPPAPGCGKSLWACVGSEKSHGTYGTTTSWARIGISKDEAELGQDEGVSPAMPSVNRFGPYQSLDSWAFEHHLWRRSPHVDVLLDEACDDAPEDCDGSGDDDEPIACHLVSADACLGLVGTICPGAGEAADAGKGKGKGKGKKKRPRDTVDEFFLGSSP